MSYLRFGVTGTGGRVSQAVLRLYATSGTSDGPAVRPAGPRWDEKGVHLEEPAGGQWHRRRRPGGGGVQPLRPSSDGVDFGSWEASSSKRPQLVVTGAPADTTPPQTSITSGPSGTLPSPSASFAFSADELAYGADDTTRARRLHDLGVNYRLALAANLAFFTLASIVFAWAVVRVMRGRRRER